MPSIFQHIIYKKTANNLFNVGDRYTRKLSYRKHDSAMRPICIWLPWKFSRVPDYAYIHFSKFFNGLLFQLSLWTCAQNLKFVALRVP